MNWRKRKETSRCISKSNISLAKGRDNELFKSQGGVSNFSFVPCLSLIKENLTNLFGRKGGEKVFPFFSDTGCRLSKSSTMVLFCRSYSIS